MEETIAVLAVGWQVVMSFFPGRRKKIRIGRGLLLFRSCQVGLSAKKSEAESVSLTNKWRSRPKAKRGL